MRSTSSSDSAVEPEIVIFCSLPVPRSLAETFTMPLASMSKVTSICGTPRGADGMPASWKRPRVLLSRAISRSPCSTWISTLVWPSAAVEYTSVLRVGMVVLRSIIFVMTPPMVSTPSDSGVTSSSRMPSTSPPNTPPWMAAPTATTSSGFTPMFGSLPVSFFTSACTAGMRVEPPTRMTSSISPLESPASFMALSTGVLQRSSRSLVIFSNSARDSV